MNTYEITLTSEEMTVIEIALGGEIIKRLGRGVEGDSRAIEVCGAIGRIISPLLDENAIQVLDLDDLTDDGIAEFLDGDF